MGGTLSSQIYIPPEHPESVCFDLRRCSLRGSYSFAAADGTFDIPLGLGVQAMEMADPVQLAQLDHISTVVLPVGVEQKRQVEAANSLDKPQVVAKLISGGGIVIASKKQDGSWVRAGVLDSDLGTLLVFGRISVDLKMVLRLETKPASGWFDRGGAFLVGRVEGLVKCFLKLRFETEADRRMAQARASVGFLTLAALVSLVLYMFKRRL